MRTTEKRGRCGSWVGGSGAGAVAGKTEKRGGRGAGYTIMYIGGLRGTGR